MDNCLSVASTDVSVSGSLSLGLAEFLPPVGHDSLAGCRLADGIATHELHDAARSSVVREHRPPLRSEEPDEVETLKLMQVEAKECVGWLVKGFPRKAA